MIIGDIGHNVLKQTQSRNSDLNWIVSLVMNDITASLRFSGKLNDITASLRFFFFLNHLLFIFFFFLILCVCV